MSSTRLFLDVVAVALGSNLGLAGLAHAALLTECPTDGSPAEVVEDTDVPLDAPLLECDIEIVSGDLIVFGKVKGSVADFGDGSIIVKTGGEIEGSVVESGAGDVKVLGGIVRGDIVESGDGDVIARDYEVTVPGGTTGVHQATVEGGIIESGPGNVSLNNVNFPPDDPGEPLPVKGVSEGSDGNVKIVDTFVQGGVVETGVGDITLDGYVGVMGSGDEETTRGSISEDDEGRIMIRGASEVLGNVDEYGLGNLVIRDCGTNVSGNVSEHDEGNLSVQNGAEHSLSKLSENGDGSPVIQDPSKNPTGDACPPMS